MKTAWLSHGTRLLHLQKQLHGCSLGRLVELTWLLEGLLDIRITGYLYNNELSHLNHDQAIIPLIHIISSKPTTRRTQSKRRGNQLGIKRPGS